MIEVIAAAALNAIFRDGYAFSSGRAPFVEGMDGGICARCNKHNVVLSDGLISCLFTPGKNVNQNAH